MTELLSAINTLQFQRNGHLGFLIYESLPNLTEDQKNHIADQIVKLFPRDIDVSNYKPFKQHLHTSFLRKLFGLTERNGTLLNITHPKRKIQYHSNINEISKWDLSFDFMNILERKFAQNKKTMGLILLYESMGHRYGDLFTVNKDESQASLMESYYRKSYKLAKGIKCCKQMYVLWFWMGCYYYNNGIIDSAKRYLMKFLGSYLKFRSHARVKPVQKLKLTFKLLRRICSEEEFSSYVSNKKVKSLMD